jgi:hypothetical protein
MSKSSQLESHAQRPSELSDDELAAIRSALAGLRFGSVQIVVQDGVIVQIDRIEKRRLRNRQGST